ncbi:MAG: tetratricopeptide (TPR) repeat protein [Limisphaerales bacterium]|jgi:tetratricopeptide (TPR) repeat protein
MLSYLKQHLLLILSILLLSPLASGMIHDPRAIEADPSSATTAIAPRLEGLGEYGFDVTTSNPESQFFFNQGLRLTYAFNHSEALRSFKEAVRLDPNNAMAYWGWALVLGPNLNLPMQQAVGEQAFEAAQHALSLVDNVTDREREYIGALAARYAPVAPNNRSALDAAYAKKMAQLTANHPDDPDAATLYAASLMNLSPWNYWQKDGAPRANTPAIINALSSVIERQPSHPGALHYHIHAVEAVHPKLGESSADALAPLMPGAGHMVHMPSHIYMRVGRYADAYRVNRAASNADSQYIAQCNAQGIYPLNYYPHNLHFLVWAAMFQGRSVEAMAGAREVQSKIPVDMEGNAFAAFETFLSQPLYVMVRFGLWQQALDEPRPAANNQFMQGVWRYARGMAFSNTGKKQKAQRELKQLESLIEKMPDEYFIGFGTAPKLLTIASLVLKGDMASNAGDFDRAIATLSRAARIEDSLLYNEPPDWYFPTRHVLGAVLLEAGYAAEAEVVYWEDLKKSPGNGFSLFGLSQSLKAQGNEPGAQLFTEKFTQAWQEADVELESSRF